MECSEFLKETVLDLDDTLFLEMRNILIDDYLPLEMAEKEDVTKPVLAELVYDFFVGVELATKKDFDKMLKQYELALDSVIDDSIASAPKQKKGQPPLPEYRALKYYNLAASLLKNGADSVQNLRDYTRIMLCLYSSVIKNKYREIKDFDYSIESIDLSKIITAMRMKTNMFGKLLFSTDSMYNTDVNTFVILVLMYFNIKNHELSKESI